MNTEEIWKDIKGYEGYYQCSNKQQIRSLDRNIKYNNRTRLHKGVCLKQTLANNGYLVVGLYKKGISKKEYVHRIMAIHFILNDKNKPCVNHIDGNKLNNALSNLEWVTRPENMKHGFDTKLIDNAGENNKQSKLKDCDILKIKSMLETGYSQSEISSLFMVDKSTISNINTGKTWKHIK